MSTDAQELQVVKPATTQRVVVDKHPVSRHHALLAVLWFSVAIAAAVGLGQGDWYVREVSNYQGQFVTFYYGLRSRVTCYGLAVPPTSSSQAVAAAGGPGSQQSNFCPNGGVAQVQTYSAISNADLTDEERIAAQHLIGSGDIIIVVLGFTILFALLAALINLNYACRWTHDVNADHESKHHRAAGIVGFLAVIAQLLSIIFWVTIFPYAYARDTENAVSTITGFLQPGFNAYLTLGVGLGIQIGGVIVGVLGIVHHHGAPHHADNKPAVLPGGRV